MQKITLYTFLCTLLFVQSTPCNSACVASMNEADQKACGIEKLTAEEKQALDAWLINQEFAKQAPQTIVKAQPQNNKIQHGEFAVQANDKMGRFITLENGIVYDIASRSRKKTMSWKVGDKVRLIEPVRPTNYKLENVAQKQTIGAKIATVKTAPKPAPVEKPIATKETTTQVTVVE